MPIPVVLRWTPLHSMHPTAIRKAQTMMPSAQYEWTAGTASVELHCQLPDGCPVHCGMKFIACDRLTAGSITGTGYRSFGTIQHYPASMVFILLPVVVLMFSHPTVCAPQLTREFYTLKHRCGLVTTPTAAGNCTDLVLNQRQCVNVCPYCCCGWPSRCGS